MKRLLQTTGTAITSVILLAGCITHEETTYRDVERARVSFENDTAGRIFYEAYQEYGSKSSSAESSTKVEIPIIFEHRQKVVNGPNQAFNDAVSQCDTDRNGIITETEARIYADMKKKH